MIAPRRPADVLAAADTEPTPRALAEQYSQYLLHMDDRGRIHPWDDLEPEDLVRDGLAVLAIGQTLAQQLSDARWTYVVEVLRAGATIGDVAVALDLEQDEVRAGLQSWVDARQRLFQRQGADVAGLTPAEADEVRALVFTMIVVDEPAAVGR